MSVTTDNLCGTLEGDVDTARPNSSDACKHFIVVPDGSDEWEDCSDAGDHVSFVVIIYKSCISTDNDLGFFEA